MSKSNYKKIGNKEIRKHTNDIENITLRNENMSKQAKTLNAQEVRRVLDYIATRKHAERNRALVYITHLAGLRVGEAASLRYNDVVDDDKQIRSEIYLSATQTKGGVARTVFVSDKLRKELEAYIRVYTPINISDKLFYSQKITSDGFSANTLTQFFHYLYRKCGLVGASSHSGRRGFITTLASKGVSVRVLMTLAGHKNISTTQAYIDINDEMLRKAVELA